MGAVTAIDLIDEIYDYYINQNKPFGIYFNSCYVKKVTPTHTYLCAIGVICNNHQIDIRDGQEMFDVMDVAERIGEDTNTVRILAKTISKLERSHDYWAHQGHKIGFQEELLRMREEVQNEN